MVLPALAKALLNGNGTHFSEFKRNEYNQTEVVASLTDRQPTLVDGLRSVQEQVEGSCSTLILTERAIYAARDRPTPGP